MERHLAEVEGAQRAAGVDHQAREVAPEAGEVAQQATDRKNASYWRFNHLHIATHMKVVRAHDVLAVCSAAAMGAHCVETALNYLNEA
jgi:hypothetical protein